MDTTSIFTEPFWLKFFITYLGITYGVYRLFIIAEDNIKDEEKEGFSNWLNDVFLNAGNRWSFFFSKLFDSVFGTNHFSLKCFFRSSLASVFSIFIIGLFILTIDNEAIGRDMSFMTFFQNPLFLFGIFINVIPDYLSLLQTRWIIKKLNSEEDISDQFILIIFDLILTFLIFFIVGFITLKLMYELTGYGAESFGKWIDYCIGAVFPSFGDFDESIFMVFWATFFTSIWTLTFIFFSLY